MSDLVDSRLANAFFDNANVSGDMPLPKTISRQISASRRKQGGLWVGGKSVLTTSTLSFSPNDMNRAMHADPEEMEINISLSSIEEVSVQRGLITDVIDIRSAAGNLKIRCFRAKSFAAAIEATRLVVD